jgi:membrane protein implicated in regulation of membrane protease activity
MLSTENGVVTTLQEIQMADSALWWLAAGGLVAAELLTGTFYLLMMAMGLAMAAVSAHLGLALTGQWVTAALAGGGSVLIWRLVKKSQPADAPANANHDVNLDIGETVQVNSFDNDSNCHVDYRGARWAASLAPDDAATPGRFTIVEVVGSRLILKPANTRTPGA